VLDQLSDQWSVDLVRVTVLVAVVLSGGALLQHTIQYLTNDTHPPVTYRLLLLPGLHRRLVLLEFVTPIRVDLLVVVALSRRRTPVSVHRHVVRTEKGRPHPAVVPSGVALRHGDDHQTVFRSLDVLVRSVLDLVAALFFGIVVPGDRLRRQNRRHLEEAAQMQALAPSHHHLLLDDAAVAHVHGAVRNVLQQPWRVWLAHVGILVPSAVRIVDASQAVVVSSVAHHQVHLFYSEVRRDEQSFVLFGNLHHLDRLSGSDVEHVEQDRRSAVAVSLPLDYLVDSSFVGSGVVDGVVEDRTADVHLDLVDHQSGEEDVSLEEDRLVVLVHHGRVHQRVGSDEVEDCVGEGFGVVDASSGSRLWDAIGQHRQPSRRRRSLFFEFTAEGRLDVGEGERTDRRAHQTIGRSRERPVEFRVVAGDLVDAL
jgi:hypothetical protein